MSLPLGAEPAQEASPKKLSWKGLLGCMIIGGFALMIVPAILFPRGFRGGRVQGRLTACKSNLKNLATALEMYASDYGGAYPPRLELLTQGNSYLKTIPTCPAAGRMTYEYRVIPGKTRNFEMYCSGDHHRQAYVGFEGDSTNYPQYNGEQGLLDHP